MIRRIIIGIFGFAHTSNSAPVSFIEPITEHKYFQESCFVLLVLGLIYFYFRGKTENKMLVYSFLESNFGVFVNNFYYAGLKYTKTEDIQQNPDILKSDSTIVEEDSSNFYRIYFTGRKNLKFGILNFNLIRRQDFLISTLYSLVWPEKDKLYIELALEDNPQPKGVFYYVRTKNLKKCLEDFEDMKFLCRKLRPVNLEVENASVFAENPDIIEVFFDRTFLEIVNKNNDLLESIECSDCIPSELNKGVNVKICLNFGRKTQADMLKLRQLIQGFLTGIDKLCAYTPNKRTFEELIENRKKFAIIKEKQRKNEAGDTKINFEERYSKMTPAEKKKFHDKEARKTQAKNKMIKIVKS